MIGIPLKTLKVLIALNPASIALTGSAGGGEMGKRSDVEVAIIFQDRNYVSRQALQRFTSHKLKIYPFRLREVLTLRAKHPFANKFYFWWLSRNSKTVYGEKILENLRVNLHAKDFNETIDYARGVALSAMVSLRNKDKETARWGFAKSCLFATAAAVGMKRKCTPSSYREIVKMGGVVFPRWKHLIRKAENMRRGKGTLSEQDIFDNIEYLHSIRMSL
ncbi:MAG: hypothetical protein HYU81_01950 [Candidatus Brennerbacteria bacterium]|nr:hypothetical protein [Candidatus Brennerbacteria bacterium]